MKQGYKLSASEYLRWAIQCLIVFFIMLFFLIGLHIISSSEVLIGVIGATSLGSTAFIAFASPQAPIMKPMRVFGGYLISAVIGMAMYHLVKHALLDHSPIPHVDMTMACAAAAAAISMYLMIIFRMEHPPAVGLSIGMVLRYWNFSTLLLVLLTLLILAEIRHLLRGWLISIKFKAGQ